MNQVKDETLQLTEEQVAHIKDILNEHLYLTADPDNDGYICSLGPDYSEDGLSDKQITEILESEEPEVKLWEIIENACEVCRFQEEDYITDEILEHWDEELAGCPADEIEEEIREWQMEHVSVTLDGYHKAALHQEVCANIVVDTGDANYDFTLNCVYPHYDGRYGDIINNEASILWLAKQQGYKKSQLNAALRDGEYGGSELLKSLRAEVLNCSSHMNALVFAVKASLGKLIALQELVTKNGHYQDKAKPHNGYLVIDKKTVCGLFDAWSGAGSILEISPEKDVVLPMKYIDSILPDGERGWYGIAETYGMCRSLWDHGGIKEVYAVGHGKMKF